MFHQTIVLQIPDFGDRFWVYPLYDQRTDEFSRLGKAYGIEPGFYLVAGPGWTGPTPGGITAVLRSSTDMVLTIPRGHQVPGMRGLYAHASDRMRDDLKHALRTRWEDSLRARAAISPHSPSRCSTSC